MFSLEDISIIAVVDVLCVALILFYIYKFTKGTHVSSILIGILIIYILSIVVKALNMEFLSAIIGQIIGVGVIALIVVFQPEIRRFLQLIGNSSRLNRGSFWSKIFPVHEYQKIRLETATQIVKACVDMSRARVGVLLAIQQRSDLSGIAESGVTIDAVITSSLLKNIFFKNSPLHDGAVLVIGGRIAAAKCILPTTSLDVPINFGMRHRAAMGLCDESDALIIAVSEETGAISVFNDGEFKLNITEDELMLFILDKESVV